MTTQEAEVQNSDYLDSFKSEKDLLLQEYEREQKRAKNITFKNLIYTYVVIFLVLLVVLPKIYISNQIYYTSREINSLYHKYTALKEENEALKRKLDGIRYQINVLDELD